MPAELIHTNLEGNTCTCRAFFEEHAQGFACEQVVLCSGFLLGLEFSGQGKNLFQFLDAPVAETKKVFIHGKLLISYPADFSPLACLGQRWPVRCREL